MNKYSWIVVAILFGALLRLATYYGEKEIHFAKHLFENGKNIEIGSKKYALPFSWAINEFDEKYVTIFNYSSPDSIYYLPYYFDKDEFTKLYKLAKIHTELKVEGCSEVYLMDDGITLYLNKNNNVIISFTTGDGKKLPELCHWLARKDQDIQKL